MVRLLRGVLTLGFIVAWAVAVFSAVMAAKHSAVRNPLRWFVTYWPAESLDARGLVYRRRFLQALVAGAGFALLHVVVSLWAAAVGLDP